MPSFISLGCRFCCTRVEAEKEKEPEDGKKLIITLFLLSTLFLAMFPETIFLGLTSLLAPDWLVPRCCCRHAAVAGLQSWFEKLGF